MSKKITIFGAGLVVKPIVDYLAKFDFEITVCDIFEEKAKALAKPYANVTGKEFDFNNNELKENLIKDCDLAMSLLPATMHPDIAKLCIKFKKDMVTASYISPQMQELQSSAIDADITILNEIGVDPGIDHMSAMKVFHHVEENGGKITGFMSYCGGLPAPEANTNPLGYKFSWSPRGVLSAARNGAHYLKDGKEIIVDGKDLFKHYWFLDVDGAGTFEAYPNRDSMGYIEKYNLKDVKTMYRGTFRNVSHCDTWAAFAELGFYDETNYYEQLPKTIKEFILTKLLSAPKDADIKKLLAEKLNISLSNVILHKFEWLGFFDETPMPIQKGAAIDVLTAIMLDKMSYGDSECDMLVLHHRFTAEYPNKKQNITSTMVDYGIKNGDSSMSRTVGLPAAIGARMILEGKITRKGVIMPIYKEIYQPVLTELETMGIVVKESYTDVSE